MLKNRSKIYFIIILFLMALGSLNFSIASKVMESSTWAQSYKIYRKHFKSLSSTKRSKCKMLLKNILSDFDGKNYCKNDNDCSLIDQNPFGGAVPFPSELTKEMKIKMKNYSELCDDGFSHSVKNNDIVNTSICWKEKFMVKTDFKKKK